MSDDARQRQDGGRAERIALLVLHIERGCSCSDSALAELAHIAHAAEERAGRAEQALAEYARRANWWQADHVEQTPTDAMFGLPRKVWAWNDYREPWTMAERAIAAMQPATGDAWATRTCGHPEDFRGLPPTTFRTACRCGQNYACPTCGFGSFCHPHVCPEPATGDAEGVGPE